MNTAPSTAVPSEPPIDRNSVAPAVAIYGEWLWEAHEGGPTPQARFDELYAAPATDEFWATPPADLGEPADLFAGPVYERGAMTLQALVGGAGPRPPPR